MNGTSTNGAAHPPVDHAGLGGRGRSAAPRTNGPRRRHQTGITVHPAAPRPGRRRRIMPAGMRGRFVRGNAGGPGNPFARRVAQLRGTLCETVTEDDIQAVARALIERAKQGDVAAARLLFSYTIGQPAPAVDPDTLDLAEWDIYRRTPANPQDLEAFVGGVPAALACDLAGILTPCLYDRAAEAIRAELTTNAATTATPAPERHEPAAPPSTNGANGRRAGRAQATVRSRRRRSGNRPAKGQRKERPRRRAAACARHQADGKRDKASWRRAAHLRARGRRIDLVEPCASNAPCSIAPADRCMSYTCPGGPMHRKLNLRFALWTLAVLVPFGVAVHFVHGYQFSRHATTLLDRGDQALAQGQTTQALTLYAHYLGFVPGDRDARLKYVRLLDQVAPPGKRLHVIHRMQQLLLDQPDLYDIRYRLANNLIGIGRPTDAMHEINALMGHWDNQAELMHMLGWCQEAREQYPEAIASFRESIKLDPTRLDAYSLLAMVLTERMHDDAEARRVLDAMVEANPKAYRAYLIRARFALSIKDEPAADRDLRGARPRAGGPGSRADRGAASDGAGQAGRRIRAAGARHPARSARAGAVQGAGRPQNPAPAIGRPRCKSSHAACTSFRATRTCSRCKPICASTAANWPRRRGRCAT